MRTRARRIAVRVSEEQYNKICRLTDRSFFTKEQVLRDIILGYPIQEDRKPECMKLIMLLRKIAGNLSGLCRNYGLSDLPIGKEMSSCSVLLYLLTPTNYPDTHSHTAVNWLGALM